MSVNLACIIERRKTGPLEIDPREPFVKRGIGRFWIVRQVNSLHSGYDLIGSGRTHLNDWILGAKCSSCSEEKSPMARFPDPKQY